MCTLVAYYRAIDGYPMVVGMNRDEMQSRPAVGPRAIAGSPRVYAPLDREAGGTWLGVNEAGLFVAILNRVSSWPGDAPAKPRSRGLLCLDALGAPSASAARELVLREMSQPRYNKFTLLLMDAASAFRIHYDSSRQVGVTELAPGLHVLVNYELHDRADTEYQLWAHRKSEQRRLGALELLGGASPATAEEAIARLKSIFVDHSKGICQHGAGFATVSSSIVAVRGERPETFLYAAGNPCTSGYEDYSHLFSGAVETLERGAGGAGVRIGG